MSMAQAQDVPAQHGALSQQPSALIVGRWLTESGDGIIEITAYRRG